MATPSSPMIRTRAPCTCPTSPWSSRSSTTGAHRLGGHLRPRARHRWHDPVELVPRRHLDLPGGPDPAPHQADRGRQVPPRRVEPDHGGLPAAGEPRAGPQGDDRRDHPRQERLAAARRALRRRCRQYGHVDHSGSFGAAGAGATPDAARRLRLPGLRHDAEVRADGDEFLHDLELVTAGWVAQPNSSKV